MATTLVYTAFGRCARISQELAKRSSLLSQQLDWPDDEDEPEIFAPGVSEFALLASLNGSLCELGPLELVEVLDASEMLGVSWIRPSLFASFISALNRCSCAGCRPLGKISVPHATCLMPGNTTADRKCQFKEVSRRQLTK